jgi:hypothetical protein
MFFFSSLNMHQKKNQPTKQEQRETPPDLGTDDLNETDNSMFTSALSAPTVDVSLSGEEDEEEENPFGEPKPRKKTPTNTTNTVESSVDNEKKVFEQAKSTINIDEDDADLFGKDNTDNNASPVVTATQIPVAGPKPQSPTPEKQKSSLFSTSSSTSTPRTPVNQEEPLFPTESSVNSPSSVRSTPPYESQFSASTSTSKNILSQTITSSKPARKYSKVHDIEITVSDPTKVGDVSLILNLSKSNHPFFP